MALTYRETHAFRTSLLFPREEVEAIWATHSDDAPIRSLEELFSRFGYESVFGFTSGATPSRSGASTAADAPAYVVDYFNRIAAVATEPAHVITVPRVEAQVRAIGQEIYDNHGHRGMVAVCEYNRQYKAYIERAWDRIGQWLA